MAEGLEPLACVIMRVAAIRGSHDTDAACA